MIAFAIYIKKLSECDNKEEIKVILDIIHYCME